MTVDLAQVRDDHGLVQAHAESAAFKATNYSFGVSYCQGHRAGWWAAVAWMLTAQQTPVVWPARAVGVHVTLLLAGVHRPVRNVDDAITAARDALHDTEDRWFDPDSPAAWRVLEPLVFGFLDLTDTELEAVA